MKKNFAMRVAACLLVVTMLSLCMVSYTYAKYTTSKSAEDEATVAKWGIELTIQSDDVLYDDDKLANDVTGLYVNSNTLAAPGTYQKLATVKMTGQPEVSYEIEVDVDLSLLNWKIGTEDYCPLVFTVDNTDYKIDPTGAIKTVADLEAAVEEAIKVAICGCDADSFTTEVGNKVTKEYETNTPAPSTLNDNVLIAWAWAFEGVDGTYHTNAKDTELGNAGTKATIDFSLTVTVNQIDEFTE